MRKTFVALIASATLIAGWNYAFSETSDRPNTETLLKLAPCISLAEKSISTFEVKGTLDINGFRLRFIVLGKKPDQLVLKLLDPLDGTPIMVGIGNSFMFYDPISSEVLLGQAHSVFTLSVEKDAADSGKTEPDDRNLKIGFGFISIGEDKKKEQNREEKPVTTVIDIHSLLASLRQSLDIRTVEGGQLVVESKTKSGGRLVAYVTPSKRQGPYTRLELYNPDVAGGQLFLVLDQIVLNQPLPAEHFAFPERKLLASALPTRQLWPGGGETIETTLSIGRFIGAIMTRLVLVGAGDKDLKSVVEKMAMRKVDWEKLEKEDKKVTTILKSIFREDGAEQTKQNEETIRQADPADLK